MQTSKEDSGFEVFNYQWQACLAGWGQELATTKKTMLRKTQESEITEIIILPMAKEARIDCKPLVLYGLLTQIQELNATN